MCVFVFIDFTLVYILRVCVSITLNNIMLFQYPSLVTEDDVEKASSVIFPHLTDVLDKCFDKFEVTLSFVI